MYTKMQLYVIWVRVCYVHINAVVHDLGGCKLCTLKYSCT